MAESPAVAALKKSRQVRVGGVVPEGGAEVETPAVEQPDINDLAARLAVVEEKLGITKNPDEEEQPE